MMGLRLSTVGAVCAILTTVSFVAEVVLVGSSGGPDLIPQTGADGLKWIADVDSASDGFVVGAWLIIVATIVAMVAFVGFYDALRDAGPVMILAPIVGVVGLTLVTISHLVPIALVYEFVPGYVDADATAKASLTVTFDALANLSQILNYVGNFLGWGVAIPLYALAVLKTSVVPRWIGWLGLVVAVFAGWLALLAPASSIFEGTAVVGFLAFFVFMLSMGISLLRQRQESDA